MSNIDNLKESEQQAKKTRPRQSRKNLSVGNWLSIANLFLTVITGIVIALYLNANDQNFQLQLKQRDEETQKKLIDLQNQSKLAQVQVKIETQSANILVGNIGPAIAKELRVSICFSDVRFTWSSAINDINQLSIYMTNKSYQYKQEITKSNCGFQRAPLNNDSKLFTIDSLAPGENLYFIAEGPVHMTFQEDPDLRNTQRKSYIKIARALIPERPSLDIDNYVAMQVGKYLDNIFTIGSVSADVSCENCNVYQDIVASYNISALIGWSWLNRQIIFENENCTEATFVFSVNYWRPIGLDSSSLGGFGDAASDAPLYFILNKTIGDYGQEEFELKDVSKEVYDAYQPK